MENRKAIFLDRDGIVNYRIVGEYINSIRNFKFIPDFLSFFPIAKSKGYLLIIISNQKGVGKGLMTFEELVEVSNYMNQQLMEFFGFGFDDIFYSIEVSELQSWNVKPNPGMLLSAIKKWNIDRNLSWMIGDTFKDVIAGKQAGVRTALVGICDFDKENPPDVYSNNLMELINLI
ncbi:MAG: HAD-IIIA family hydrolase [Candidatus Kapaibacteriales bacterium]